MEEVPAQLEIETINGKQIVRRCLNPEIATYVTIPSPIVGIGDGAFIYNKQLHSVVMNPEMEIIGRHAFEGCVSLTMVQLSHNLRSIGEAAFEDCALKEIQLPPNLKEIGDSAFAFCKQMESIRIPDTVETIGKLCFDNCSALRKVHLPETLKVIDMHTFMECINLTNINLPQSLEAIEELAFGKTGLMKVIIPEGVKRLGSHAFALCKHLEEVTIPNSVEKIIDDIFIYCNRLRTIYIPKGTTPWFEVMLEGHENQFVEQDNSVTKTPEQTKF